MINLQLARLAVTQGNVPLAVSEYQDALDGTWNGDGTLRRREVRLELSRYLIAQRRFDEARNQLLIAAGNASDNHQLQLTVGALLEQAEGESDAYNLYRKAMSFSDTRTAGLIGAGRAAAAQSRYLLARNLLDQATLQPDFPRLPADQRAAVHSLLGEAVAILDLYPAQNLPLHVQAVRTIHALQILRAQIEACGAAGTKGAISPEPTAGNASVPPAAISKHAAGNPPAQATSARPAPVKDHSSTAEQPAGPLRSAISAVQLAGSTLAGVAPLAPPAPAQPGIVTRIQALSERLGQLPPDDLLEHRMERDPALLENTLQLIYDAENAEAQFAGTLGRGLGGQGLPGCAPTSHDAALLLKIASAPDQIEQQ
jgi:tetratricopeptide (TPR) repeat protein